MSLKNFLAQACLLLLLWGCSGAEFTEPPMPPPSPEEGWGEGAEPGRSAGAEAPQSDRPPVATLRSPEVGAHYHTGSVITFEGRGTDAEDGALPASAFTWRVDFHQGGREYPFVPPISGMARGAFTVPEVEGADASVWYRVHLRVRDSTGNTHAVFRDVLPAPARVR